MSTGKTSTIAVTIQDSGYSTSIGGPTSIGPYTNTAAAGILNLYMPNVGDNFLVFPAGTEEGIPIVTTELWIDPTSANSGMALTLKGVPGDTGVPISNVNPSLIPCAQADWRTEGSPIAQIVLNSSAAGVLPQGWI